MTFPTLPDLGWSAHFLGQLSIEELETLTPLRLAEVHRDRATGLGPGGTVALTYPPEIGAGDTAVGDWVLADPGTCRIRECSTGGARSRGARPGAKGGASSSPPISTRSSS
jgi:ribosome biogenesis GTPase / thiamine phosphate phosphatase